MAVLSSRTLEDLVSRVPIPGLYLGGASGLEWRLPGGRRVRPGKEAVKRLEAVRRSVLPELRRISAFPGVDLEDKRWSVALHFRSVLPETLRAVSPLVRGLEKHPGLRVCKGPFAAEVLLSPSGNKSFGVRRLCGFLRFDPSGGRILYAGDDENDAAAMRWVISRRGTAIAIGNRIRVPGVLRADGPASLVRVVRELADPARRIASDV